MLKEEIVVGKSYVNEGARIIREVVEEVDRHNVRFNAFEMDSGRLSPTRHRVCSRRELASWADREAASCETRRIHPFDQDANSDMFAAPERGTLRVEEARAALDGMAGTHTFQHVR